MSFNKRTVSPITRVHFARVLVTLLAGVLLVRLWYLQCLYGDYYRDKSENNRIRTIRTLAPRGSIYDRDGRVLVRNRPSYAVSLLREDAGNPEEVVREVARVVNRDPEKVLQDFLADKTSRRFEPKVILRDVSIEDLAKVKAQIFRYPSVLVESVPTRAYPYGDSASHLFGYVREINKAQLEQLGDSGYQLGDMFGQTGLEKTYEDKLRGISGYQQVEVDAGGRRRKVLGKKEDLPGKDIILSIDVDLQKIGEKALGNKRGAIVALDPANGDVLALVSKPTFDANIFSGAMTTKDWEGLTKDPSKPLLNRAIGTAYPPGSTSKLLWSVAGLSEGKISPNSIINCPGYFSLGKRRYLCHKKTGHGGMDLKTALTVSCNAYFYNLGQALGITNMTQYLGWFGYGQLTGLDLIGEEAGVLAGEEWKKKRFGEKWYPGDTIPVSIGQGYFVATPIQMAVLAMLISNNGKYFAPRLVSSWKDPQTGKVTEREPELKWTVPVKESVFSTVREFSASVVDNERGTGKRAAIKGIRIGGKTGTAQVGRRGTESLGEAFKDHAWFVAYAPIEKPQIAMAIIVENSGHGGEFSAPIAREIMAEFFRKKGMLSEDDIKLEEKSANMNYEEDSESVEFIEETFEVFTGTQ